MCQFYPSDTELILMRQGPSVSFEKVRMYKQAITRFPIDLQDVS